jgi:type I restriction enzyme, S subunit
MKSSYKRIGDCIQLVDERNTNMQVKLLLGLSISKEFIPSVANIVGTDMKNYKIIRRNQFACSTMQVRRDRKMPIALYTDMDEAIISAAYPIFEVADTELILPEYLMMWFSRTEFDREACFYAIGGVRGSIEWEDFCNMQFPVPSIAKQKEIVKEYNVLVDRINLNNRLIQKLEETARAIYKQWFVDFEFPNENGKPYKSNGGEMEFNKELDKEIPIGWEAGTLGDILIFNYGKALSVDARLNGTIKVYSSAGQFGYCNKALVNEPTIIVGRKGSIGTIFYETEPSYCIDTAYFIKGSECKFPLIFTFDLLRNLDLPSMNEDSAVPGLNRNTVYAIKIFIPKENIVKEYSVFSDHFKSMNTALVLQNKKLIEFKEVLLSKLATMEDSQ